MAELQCAACIRLVFLGIPRNPILGDPFDAKEILDNFVIV